MTTRLVKHQKLTKRQIKEDPLVTAAFRGAQAWEQHGSRILLALGAIVVLLVLAVLIGRSRTSAEERASGDVFRAQMSLSQGDFPTATQMLKEVVDNAPGTQAARHAMMLLGDAFEASGKPAEAVTWYRRSLTKAGNDRDAKAGSLHGLAAALEDRGDFAQAASNYEQLAKVGVNDNERGRAMLAEARCYAKAGQTAKAIAIYKDIQKLPVVAQDIWNRAGVGLGELAPTASAP